MTAASRATLLWMKDLLERVAHCHDACQAQETGGEQLLLGSMERDLDELRRLCEQLRSANRRENAVCSQS